MTALLPTRHISESITCAEGEVYEFARNPVNLPQWASGLGAITETGGEWVAELPIGKITITFALQNTFGVLDHQVTLPNGETFYNPMRVFRNEGGCEVVFTLFRLPGVDDAAFEADAATIARDLATLKSLLER